MSALLLSKYYSFQFWFGNIILIDANGLTKDRKLVQTFINVMSFFKSEIHDDSIFTPSLAFIVNTNFNKRSQTTTLVSRLKKAASVSYLFAAARQLVLDRIDFWLISDVSFPVFRSLPVLNPSTTLSGLKTMTWSARDPDSRSLQRELLILLTFMPSTLRMKAFTNAFCWIAGVLPRVLPRSW